MKMDYRVKLKDIDLAEVFWKIWKSRIHAEVLLRSQSVKKSFSIHQGKLVQARSNVARERLGEYLLNHGIISNDEYDQSVDTMFSTGKQQGQILIEMGAMDKEDIPVYIRQQQLAIALDAFSWDSGDLYVRLLNQSPVKSSISLDLRILCYKSIETKKDDFWTSHVLTKGNLLAQGEYIDEMGDMHLSKDFFDIWKGIINDPKENTLFKLKEKNQNFNPDLIVKRLYFLYCSGLIGLDKTGYRFTIKG